MYSSMHIDALVYNKIFGHYMTKEGTDHLVDWKIDNLISNVKLISFANLTRFFLSI